jgi:molybdate transport system ATP-binding protein
MSEQRLLLLARALVKMPSLLIFDEPCQGLEHSQIQRFTEIRKMVCLKLETTLIYVSHHPEEIVKCVNQLLQLEEGTVKYCGKY